MSLGIGTINTGSYFGDGQINLVNAGGASSNSRARNASSVNINRIARNLASAYGTNMEMIYAYMQEGDINTALNLRNNIFEDAKQTVENYGYDVTDEQIRNILDQSYQNITGESFALSAKNSTKGSFVTGLIEGLPGGILSSKTSEAEANAKIAGVKTPIREKVKESAGSVFSGVASGAVIGFGIGAFGGPIGWVGGAVIGGIWGLAKSLIF